MGKSKSFPDPIPNKFLTTLCKLLFVMNAWESSHQFQSEILEVSGAIGDSLDDFGVVVRAFEDVGSKPHYAASRPDRLKLGGDGVQVGKQLVVFAQLP